MSVPTIIDAVNDPAIWKPHFKNPQSWAKWFTLVKALFGLPLDPHEIPFFTECTGRTTAPVTPCTEGWLICGRRAGKSRILSLIAAYLSEFVDWSPYLSPGERGIITVLATDRRQCRTIMNYLRAFLLETPILSSTVTRDTPDEIELDNGVIIEVVTCSFKSVRGRTILASLADESAFWSSEDGSNPASEVFAALRPAMATIPGSLLLVASSPYARRGPLFDTWRNHYGQDGRVLVWKAPTWAMNPLLSRSTPVIADAYVNDPASADAEYGAEWRRDVESFVNPAVVESATMLGRFELPPDRNTHYVGFADAAGGSGGDSFTAAVVHLDRHTKHVIVDAVREKTSPFSPSGAIQELSSFFKAYHVSRITLDRYAGDFPSEQFKRNGIACDACQKPKSQLYAEYLPLLNSGRSELLDHPRLIKQLLNLERRTARGGRDTIDHPPGGHDDIINSVAGASVFASAKMPLIFPAKAMAAIRRPSFRSPTAVFF